MTTASFVNDFEAYSQWRQELSRRIVAYRQWLGRENLNDSQRDLRLLVGPSGTIDVHQVPADQHRGRHAGQDIALDQPAHGGVRRPEIVAGGPHLHILNCRLHFHSHHARCVRAVLCPHYQRTKPGGNR